MKKLKEVRLAKKLTQSQLAAMTGIPSTVISNYECGVRKPSLVNLVKLLKALECKLEDIV